MSSQLIETEFKGDSSKLVNGLKAGQYFYMYSYTGNDRTDQQVITNNSNINKILLQIQAMRQMNNMQNLLQISENDKEGKVANNKFKAIQEFNYELAIFILRWIHDIVWLNWKWNEKADLYKDKTGLSDKVLSGIDVTTALQYVIKAVQGIIQIQEVILDSKFSGKLLQSVLEYDIDKKIVNVKHELGVLQNVNGSDAKQMTVKNKKPKKSKKVNVE